MKGEIERGDSFFPIALLQKFVFFCCLVTSLFLFGSFFSHATSGRTRVHGDSRKDRAMSGGLCVLHSALSSISSKKSFWRKIHGPTPVPTVDGWCPSGSV